MSNDLSYEALRRLMSRVTGEDQDQERIKKRAQEFEARQLAENPDLANLPEEPGLEESGLEDYVPPGAGAGLLRRVGSKGLSMIRDKYKDKDDKKGRFGDTYGGAKDYTKSVPKRRQDMSPAEIKAADAARADRIAERKAASTEKEIKAEVGAEKSSKELSKQYDKQSTQKDPMFKSNTDMDKLNNKPKTGEEWLKNLPDLSDRQKEAFLKLNAEQQKAFFNSFKNK